MVTKGRCRICGKPIEAMSRRQLRMLLAQHMLTHDEFVDKLLSMTEEGAP